MKNTIWPPGEQRKPGQPTRGSGENTFLKSSSNVQLAKCLLLILSQNHPCQQKTKRQGFAQSTEWEEKAEATLWSFWTETCKIGGCPVLKGSKLIMSALVRGRHKNLTVVPTRFSSIPILLQPTVTPQKAVTLYEKCQLVFVKFKQQYSKLEV